jgi:hypothetical protein
MLQSELMIVDGQRLPPYAGAVLMLRVLKVLPTPQDLEQEAGVPQSDTTQSTGHGAVAHA